MGVEILLESLGMRLPILPLGTQQLLIEINCGKDSVRQTYNFLHVCMTTLASIGDGTTYINLSIYFIHS